MNYKPKKINSNNFYLYKEDVTFFRNCHFFFKVLKVLQFYIFVLFFLVHRLNNHMKIKDIFSFLFRTKITSSIFFSISKLQLRSASSITD